MNPLYRDLEAVLERTRPLWEDLRGERVLITGGTGFFGCWLLETFLHANARLSLGARACVLSRDPKSFAAKAPHLHGDAAVDWIAGDVRTFAAPAGVFPFVIHAATEASRSLINEQPRLMFDTIVDGTRRALEVAARAGCRRFLLTSSGAVYGRQPAEMTHVSEAYAGAPDTLSPGSVYGEGKRAAELLCALAGRDSGMAAVTARCFAFLGPYLPLDIHFAAGNLLRDALAGGPLRVAGDGTPYRSYLYAADLAVWLWTLLFRGRGGAAYNVGSETSVTIAELAREIAAAVSPGAPVLVARTPEPGRPVERYVPSTALARAEFDLREWTSLAEAARLTAAWRRGRPA